MSLCNIGVTRLKKRKISEFYLRGGLFESLKIIFESLGLNEFCENINNKIDPLLWVVL